MSEHSESRHPAHFMAKAVLTTSLASVCSDDEAMGVEDVFEEQEEVRRAAVLERVECLESDHGLTGSLSCAAPD